MLVLSRKKNESIVIGENVRIEILKVSGNTVRIGIQAPRDVKVLRGELAPYGISDEGSSSDSIADKRVNLCRESADDYSFEVTLPLESEESESLPNPFVVQTM
ncbi:carbon storage regulator [Mariniblastus fucicola]|uniref:Translational regulator CsrA n=1 Tax=Mariniblastus fucicola TaxID=980251 RepID=A0A5B9PC75_9BACT|nr:carbon storage regulator [Mariniblastus fucicola]QEG20711.1 hypothetical protein MFFC18_05620 [Mariniblastus fucicola]